MGLSGLIRASFLTLMMLVSCLLFCARNCRNIHIGLKGFLFALVLQSVLIFRVRVFPSGIRIKNIIPKVVAVRPNI